MQNELEVARMEAKLLTFAGREVLIKSVANAIPVFPMSCFKFLKKVCAELDGMVAKFWWGQKGQEGRIHWKAWKSLGKAKGDSGMGFRELENFNKALLAKTAWRVLQNPDDLWCRILKGIYFPKEEFLNAKRGNKASWGWTSVLEGRELLRKDLCWRVGSGRRVKVFVDPWIPMAAEHRLSERELSTEMEKMTVDQLMIDGKWDLTGISGVISEDESAMIKHIRIPLTQIEDSYVWMGSRDGNYSVKLGYRSAMSDEDLGRKDEPSVSYRASNKIWKIAWGIKVPPKVQHFLWRALNSLATNAALFRRKCARNPLCSICGVEEETVEHMLFMCPWDKYCWFGSPLVLRVREDAVGRFDRWFESWISHSEGPEAYGLALFAGISWGIWKSRCQWVFEGVEVDPWKCVARAMRLVSNYWEADERKARQHSGRNQEVKKVI